MIEFKHISSKTLSNPIVSCILTNDQERIILTEGSSTMIAPIDDLDHSMIIYDKSPLLSVLSNVKQNNNSFLAATIENNLLMVDYTTRLVVTTIPLSTHVASICENSGVIAVGLGDGSYELFQTDGRSLHPKNKVFNFPVKNIQVLGLEDAQLVFISNVEDGVKAILHSQNEAKIIFESPDPCSHLIAKDPNLICICRDPNTIQTFSYCVPSKTLEIRHSLFMNSSFTALDINERAIVVSDENANILYYTKRENSFELSHEGPLNTGEGECRTIFLTENNTIIVIKKTGMISQFGISDVKEEDETNKQYNVGDVLENVQEMQEDKNKTNIKGEGEIVDEEAEQPKGGEQGNNYIEIPAAEEENTEDNVITSPAMEQLQGEIENSEELIQDISQTREQNESLLTGKKEELNSVEGDYEIPEDLSNSALKEHIEERIADHCDLSVVQIKQKTRSNSQQTIEKSKEKEREIKNGSTINENNNKCEPGSSKTVDIILHHCKPESLSNQGKKKNKLPPINKTHEKLLYSPYYPKLFSSSPLKIDKHPLDGKKKERQGWEKKEKKQDTLERSQTEKPEWNSRFSLLFSRDNDKFHPYLRDYFLRPRYVKDCQRRELKIEKVTSENLFLGFDPVRVRSEMRRINSGLPSSEVLTNYLLMNHERHSPVCEEEVYTEKDAEGRPWDNRTNLVYSRDNLTVHPALRDYFDHPTPILNRYNHWNLKGLASKQRFLSPIERLQQVREE